MHMSSEQFLQMNCFSLLGLGFLCLCVLLHRASLSELAILYFVYFLFVTVWLSVPVQSIAWKE